MAKTAHRPLRIAAGNPFARPVFTRARRLCLSLPESNETLSWGHPNFKAGRKTFCSFEIVKGRPSIAFRLPQKEAAAALTDARCFATPYGRGLWVSVWVDGAVDWKRIASLVDRSYRTVATKRQIVALEASA